MRLSSLAFASYLVCVHLECMLCAWPRTSPCSPRPRLGASLSPSSMVRFIFLEIVVPSLIDFLRMLASSHPPPSLMRSRDDFSTLVAVLSDSYSLTITLLSPGSAQGRLLYLLLSCSEFLFISFDFLAFGVWFVLFGYFHCLRHCSHMPVFMLCSQQLSCPLQLEL